MIVALIITLAIAWMAALALTVIIFIKPEEKKWKQNEDEHIKILERLRSHNNGVIK